MPFSFGIMRIFWHVLTLIAVSRFVWLCKWATYFSLVGAHAWASIQPASCPIFNRRLCQSAVPLRYRRAKRFRRISLHSPRFDRIHEDSLEFRWIRLNSLGLPFAFNFGSLLLCFYASSPGFASIPLDSLGFAWIP